MEDVVEVVPEVKPLGTVYPRWYFRGPDGHGVYIQTANNHLDWPEYTGNSPLDFGVETEPGAK